MYHFRGEKGGKDEEKGRVRQHGAHRVATVMSQGKNGPGAWKPIHRKKEGGKGRGKRRGKYRPMEVPSKKSELRINSD